MTKTFQPGNMFKFPDTKEVYRFVRIEYLNGKPVIFFEDEAGKIGMRSGFHLSDLIHV